MRTVFHKEIFLLLLVPLLLLVGCRAEKNLPLYQFELGKMPVLTVDGVRYIADTDVVLPGLYRLGLWSFTGEIGDAIGVCENGGDDICQIEGDEENDFFFVRPNHFVFGPYYIYFCVREDLHLTPPSAETVSCTDMIMTIGDSELELTDPELIAELLDFYFEDTGDAVSYYAADEGMTSLTLIFHHRDFPFLTAEIKGCQNIETGASYLTCSDEIRRELPAELAARLTKKNFKKPKPGKRLPT